MGTLAVQLLDLDYRLLLRRKQELKKGIEFSAPEQYYGAGFREKSVRWNVTNDDDELNAQSGTKVA